MATPSEPEHRPADVQQLQPLPRLFRIVDGWSKRSGSGPPAVQPHSELADTDTATAPYQTSHAVTSALSHGIDHLHCLKSLLVEARMMHTYAPFSLLRSAIENLSAAVWLLSPTDPALRAQRRLQLAVADARRGEEVGTMLGIPPNRPLAVRLEEMAAAAERAGVRRDVVLGGTISFGRIVRDAGAETKIGSDLTVAIWKLCSGITHGQTWASLSLLDRTLVPSVGSDDEGVQTYRLSAPERGLVSVTQVVVLVGHEAWRLYDRRRLHFR